MQSVKRNSKTARTDTRCVRVRVTVPACDCERESEGGEPSRPSSEGAVENGGKNAVRRGATAGGCDLYGSEATRRGVAYRFRTMRVACLVENAI